MRTTMHLPDDLYRELKRVAADDGRTVTSLVEEALRDQLRRRANVGTDPEPYRVAPVDLGQTLPGVDITNGAALLDLMEGR